MAPLGRLIAGVTLLTVLAAGGGVWIGNHYGSGTTGSSPGLDEVLHNQLNLTAEQERRIADIEAQFAMRRASLEDEMRAANRDLAAAIVAESEYGVRAQSAIERFHRGEAALQEETVKHVLAMRSVLTPEQIARFNEAISTALTAN